jgi:hypothetical protein
MLLCFEACFEAKLYLFFFVLNAGTILSNLKTKIAKAEI